MAEQIAISDTIGRKVEAVAHTIELARRQTDQIREYRDRLITDVVTGKLDVRQAAADLDEGPLTDQIGVTKGGAVQDSRGTDGGIATEASS